MAVEAPAVFTHNLDEVIVVVTRVFNQQSFEMPGRTGDGIQINITDPKYADQEASDDGKIIVRSFNARRIAKIMLTGIQYAPAHKEFARLYIAPPDEDIIDINVSDLSNKLLYLAQNCWLSKLADAQYTTNQTPRTHEISVPFIEMDKELIA